MLVGDPQQLPPTVLSKAACAGLSQSLFERLQRGGADATLLRFQYRMHPAISAFPSAFFYDSDLLDGTSADGKRAAFHAKVRPCGLLAAATTMHCLAPHTLPLRCTLFVIHHGTATLLLGLMVLPW